MPRDLTYTPGHHWLTPCLDFCMAALTRGNRWRSALVAQVRPRPEDVIIDVGCGTGSLLVRLGKAAPSARLIGIDRDPAILARARERAAAAGVSVELCSFARQAAARLGGIRPTKVVSSLLFHQVPMDEKTAALAAMHALLEEGGEVHIADYGLQRTALMRALFAGIIQNVAGRVNTEPNGRGVLPELMHAAGFRGVEETRIIPTLSGSISLYRGLRAS